MFDTAQTKATAFTAVAALTGAAIAASVGIPAGALVGSMIAVAVLAATGTRVFLPIAARDIAFLVIGVSLGSGINASVIPQLPGWSISLVLLVLSMVATIAASSWLLTRAFGIDRETAVLASSPGTMSNAVAIAIEGKGDAGAVTILQLMRLMVLVALVPPLAAMLNIPAAPIAASDPMPLWGIALLLALGLPLGRWAGRHGVSAACLLMGIVLSAAAHLADIVHGLAPGWMIFLGFTVTGAVLGTRIGKVEPRAVLRLLWAGLAVVAMALGMALLFAVPTQMLTGLPMGQVLIAFAPGGVEAMAAIALALGYDPAYVAAHHFARIVILLALVPLFLRR